MNADERTLEKVRNLLVRAGHPGTPEEEARTSAAIAARMIYACGFVVELPVRTKQPPPPPETPPQPKPRSPPKAKPYRVITSRWSGWCKSCGGAFEVDEAVAWIKGFGCTHYECRSFWDDFEAETTPF